MKHILLFTLCCFIGIIIWANDGAFFAYGNQLIPIEETNISVTKEILSITRNKESGYIHVDVYYEFENPSDTKSILVGFEAPPPLGDVDGTPVNGQHPYIEDFTVEINNTLTPYKTSILDDDYNIVNGGIPSLSEEEAMGEYFNENAPNFYYVNYFNANFTKGKNIVKHTYKLKESGSIITEFDFEYILTAANRWGNKQIDDFTLIIDMGEFQGYNVSQTFFTEIESWSGGKFLLDSTLEVFPYDTPITFKKIDFHPEGELRIYSFNANRDECEELFDCGLHDLPYNYEQFWCYEKATDELSYKVLRNLPYAKRGYIFKDPYLQEYYETQKWYTANSSYQDSFTKLSSKERDWLGKIKSFRD